MDNDLKNFIPLDPEHSNAQDGVRDQSSSSGKSSVLPSDDLTGFKGTPNQIRLTEDERVRMRENIRAYVSAHRRESAKRYGWRWLVAHPSLGIAGLLIIAGAGSSFAAEGALPGDLLYPVKVKVNEEVRGALALSSESRAEWQTTRVSRRLEEAETLAKNGAFTSSARSEVATSIQKSAQAVSDQIEKMAERGNADGASRASSGLEVSLSAHERILLSLAPPLSIPGVPPVATAFALQGTSSASGGGKSGAAPSSKTEGSEDKPDNEVKNINEVRTLVDVVRGERRAAKRSRDAVNRAFKNASTDALKKFAESAHDDAASRLEALKAASIAATDNISAKTKSALDAIITEAARLIIDGDAKIKSGDIASALANYRRAAEIIGGSELILRLSPRFNLEIVAEVGTDAGD